MQVSKLNEVAATMSLVIENDSFRKKKVVLFGIREYGWAGYKTPDISIISLQSTYSELLKGILTNAYKVHGIKISTLTTNQLRKRWRIGSSMVKMNFIHRAINYITGKGYYSPIRHQSKYVNIRTIVEDPHFKLSISADTKIEFVILPRQKMEITLTIESILTPAGQFSTGFN